MNIYVWRSSTFSDYYAGQIIVLATDVASARDSIIDDMKKNNPDSVESVTKELQSEPAVYSSGEPLIIWGGG